VADALGPAYVHPWLRFGPADVDGYALRIEVRLIHPGLALRRADALDLSTQAGPTKRAWRLLDMAQAHHMRTSARAPANWPGRSGWPADRHRTPAI